MNIKRKANFKGLALILIVNFLSACSQVSYYYQSVQGQMSILARAKAIDEVVSSDGASDELKSQLAYIKDVRAYASELLGLPDNKSYTRYVDLGRDYVVWNVVATPPLSLKTKKWCYPIIGCQLYRGFFKKAAALKLANELKDEYDVIHYGVVAYSTLGYFADPVLSSFVASDKAWLTSLIFHELSHQVIYVDDDTQFNESFATAVEELGLLQWQRDKNMSFDAGYKNKSQLLTNKLLEEREQLTRVYQSTLISHNEKLKQKNHTFGRIYEACRSIYDEASFCERYKIPNNAWLALTASYEGLKQEFKQLYYCVDESWVRFYDAVAHLAELKKEQRAEIFNDLSGKYCPNFDVN